MTSELGPAGKLIEQGWTQYVVARDKNGLHVDAHSDNAVCWCIYGAVHKVYINNGEKKPDNERPAISYYEACSRLKQALGSTELSVWNDASGRTKEEVLEVFRKAGV